MVRFFGLEKFHSPIREPIENMSGRVSVQFAGRTERLDFLFGFPDPVESASQRTIEGNATLGAGTVGRL